MRKTLLLITSLSLLTLSGCARHAQVVIDPQGVDMGQYQRDLAECRQLAKQVRSKAGAGMIGGAIVGGIAGAIVGNHRTSETAAKLGALSGTVRGGRATHHERTLVLKNCLRNRGYQVLN